MPPSNRRPNPRSEEFNWQSYEELVKDIYQALGRADGVTVECWGRQCTVQVAGGVQRQVDVLTRHTDGVRLYRTAISCKWWNARVNVAHVSDFALIVQDAQLTKGIIVSKMGFTAPAQHLANAKNIGLVELRQPLDGDWEGSITHVKGEIKYLPSPEFRYNLNMTQSGTDPRSQADQGRPMAFASSPDRFVITEPDGPSKTLLERARDAHLQEVDGAEFVIDFPDGTILTMPDEQDHPASGASLHRVRVHVSVPPPLTIEIDVNAANRIYMIMKFLSDDRRLNITDDGEITEVT